MKHILLAASIPLCIAHIGFGQHRVPSRSETSSLRLVSGPVNPGPDISSVAERPRRATNPYLPSPPFGETYKLQVKAGTPNAVENTRKPDTVRPELRSVEEFETVSVKVSGKSYLAPSKYGLRGYSTGDVLVDSYIIDSSRRYNIDPLLIYAQMRQESSFKKKATSHKGASGLMQLMPATARRLGVTKIYDPQQNIEGGIKYMRMLLNMFDGDLKLALAGYNAGEGAVIKYGRQVPPYNETQDYVRRITARYRALSLGIE